MLSNACSPLAFGRFQPLSGFRFATDEANLFSVALRARCTGLDTGDSVVSAYSLG